jgi:hypothetical protein
MADDCALCGRHEAMTRLKHPGILGTLLRQETRLDIAEPQIVIPLCGRCAKNVDQTIDLYDYGGPDEKRQASEQLTKDAERMNLTTVQTASGH